jgi:hypothetical protein
MVLDADDFTSMSQFPLRWRWTDAHYARLSEEELAGIRPLREARASELWDGLAASTRNLAGETLQVDQDDEACAGPTREWLDARLPLADREILVLWSTGIGVVANRRVFVERWDDFWYPGSDDVVVVPGSESWVLHIHHSGRIVFQPRRAG